MSLRSDGRRAGQLRPLRIETGYLRNAHGSALIRAGGTTVLCTAMLEPGVPPFLVGKGVGWITAEYGMLPASTPTRKPREITRPDGRAQEIRRIIGRALRAAVDRKALGERTLWLDCDVLEADGGTRTLAVTGAWVALALAVRRARSQKLLAGNPVIEQIAAVSVGVVDSRPLLDLCYVEDVAAEVDMNVVMTRGGQYIELQGTAERAPFSGAALNRLLALAGQGCRRLMTLQRSALRTGKAEM